MENYEHKQYERKQRIENLKILIKIERERFSPAMKEKVELEILLKMRKFIAGLKK